MSQAHRVGRRNTKLVGLPPGPQPSVRSSQELYAQMFAPRLLYTARPTHNVGSGPVREKETARGKALNLRGCKHRQALKKWKESFYRRVTLRSRYLLQAVLTESHKVIALNLDPSTPTRKAEQLQNGGRCW